MELNTSKINLISAEKGLTRSELSKICGLSRQSISTIITRGTCSVVSAGKIAQGLGVPVAEIVKVERAWE